MSAHVFTADSPEPRPPGFAWWKDLTRRARCSCGWKADANSTHPSQARDLWRAHLKGTTP